MIQLLMGVATTGSNTNLLEGGVIVMGTAMLLREVLPVIMKAVKGDDNKETPIQSNGYLKRTEFDKFSDKVQYRTECDVISRNIKDGLKEQKERMEKMDVKMDIHFNDLKTILKDKS